MVHKSDTLLKFEKGFSLVELLLAVAISGFVLSAMYSVQRSLQSAYAIQADVCAIQQNLRGGLCFMERELRMAGYDPKNSGLFGITDIRLDQDGNGTITFTVDDNLNQQSEQSDSNGAVDAQEVFVYSLYDYPTASPDGVLDLARKYGGARQLAAENIDALGFAFAFDSAHDGDNALDKDINGNIIWAIDTDGDKRLDINLDTDNDGDIDVYDDPAGTSLSHPDNGSLPNIALSDIKAVRIWLLARGEREKPGFITTTTYVVSNQRIKSSDGISRRMLTSIVRCRNLGRQTNN